MACSRPAGPSDPDRARIHTEDVQRFWTVVDQHGGSPLLDFARALRRDYVDAGSYHLRKFLQASDLNALELARRYQENPERYQATRDLAESLTDLEPEIRELFQRLKEGYPDATFPDLHFVVGGMGSGGQGSYRALVVSTEMAVEPSDVLLLVAHEMAHAQQRQGVSPDLLTRVLREGTADLTAEILTGRPIHNRTYAWGSAHEFALWDEFRTVMQRAPTHGTWVRPRAGSGLRPGGLGYFLGYRIARSYWDGVGAPTSGAGEAHPTAPGPGTDGGPTLEGLLRWKSAWGFLEESGYEPARLARVFDGARRAIVVSDALPTPGSVAWESVEADARVSGPDGAFWTRIVSRADGGVHMVQTESESRGAGAFFEARLGPGEEWVLSAAGERARPTAENRSFIRGHELHAAVLFPETRLYGPVLKELGEDIGITWRTGRTDSLTVHYSKADTLPLGMTAHWMEPEVHVAFDDWEDHPAGLRLFRRATFTQGNQAFEYDYRELSIPGRGQSSLND